MPDKKKFEIFPAKYGFFPYMFLIYLFMPGYYIFFEPGWKRGVGYVLLAIFLVTYRQLYQFIESNNKTYTYWLILQVSIILILAVFYNINHLFLGFFPANFIGYYKDRRKFVYALILFGVTIISPLIIRFNELYPNNMLYFIPFIVIMLVSPFGIRSMVNKMELEKQLDEANERIKELVKRDERMRIARDLHDTLGHTLSLITLKSQLVGKLITKDSNRAISEAKEIERTSRAALAQVRELVSDMRTITVSEELIESESILEAAGISFFFHGETKLTGIPVLTQNILSMCLREGVTNVVKHSGATKCLVHIAEKAGEILISIHDNGKGISLNNKSGNGLNGMSERLKLIDGTVNIVTENGTKLTITVPIIVKEREEGVVS
ncbi:sensor histidine kinase [Bacillus sp. FJAT-29937]|uniref:sensor histidine kinase n=1 Tax=Bacillus sp. FJAT-29937 TaxID=1720553 RepID=UPI0008327234|nr:sensor histidine kinase [Bacillus sp. FJAT-29937]